MSYLRNCWYVAGFPHEIGRTPMTRMFLDEPVLMYRREDGGLVAMDNRCPHRMAPLSDGKLIDDAIQCPYHGLQFDGTGACVKLPSGGLAPPRARLKVYPVVERHAAVWIWMGDPALADAARIPDFSCVENPAFGWFDGYLHARANFQLLVDNLLDLSHAEFLHPMLASDGWGARNKQTIRQDGNTVFVNNVAEDDNIIPLMAQIKPDMGKIGTMIQTERWEAPGLLELNINYYSDGDKFEIPSGHYLTPETRLSTHYFVRGGQGIDPGNEALSNGMKEGVLTLFQTEDIRLIEAQQRHIGDGDLLMHDPAILQGDAGSMRARRWLAKLIREEQALHAVAA